MMKKPKLALLIAPCLLLAACASGPKFSDASTGIPKMPDGDGRIYFYRTQFMAGAAVQPTIYLNGQQVSSCAPKGVSIADVAPGNYKASVMTEVEHELTFAVAAGEEKFVRCYITMGLLIGHANVELIDPAKGRDEIQGLSFTGQKAITTQVPPFGTPPAPPAPPQQAPAH